MNLKLVNNNQLAIENNNLVFITGIDFNIQAVSTRLKMVRGEWFLNRLEGVPYIEKILGEKTPSIPVIKKIYSEAILKCPNVKTIEYINLEYIDEERRLTIDFACKSTTDEIFEVKDFIIGEI